MKLSVRTVAALLLLVACQPVAPAAPAATVPPVSGDATAAIQAVLNRGAVTIDRPLTVNGTLTPPTGSTIRFVGAGELRRTTAPAANSTPVIRVTADRVTITAPRIVGPNPCYWTYFDTGYRYPRYDPTREEQHGIAILGGTGHRVTDATILNTWGDAIYIGGGHPTDVRIVGLTATCLGRSGVSNTGSSNVTILDANVSGAFWWGFNIEPFNDRYVHDYTVTRATIGFARDAPIFAGGPYFSCDVRRAAFTGVTYTAAIRSTPSIAGCVTDHITVK